LLATIGAASVPHPRTSSKPLLLPAGLLSPYLTKSLSGRRLAFEAIQLQVNMMALFRMIWSSKPAVTRNATAALALLLTISVRGAAQQPSPSKSDSTQAATRKQSNDASDKQLDTRRITPESGFVSNNIYTNEFFAFKYHFPKSLSVQSGRTGDFLLNVDKAQDSKATAPSVAVLGFLASKTHQLLVLLERPFDTLVPVNPGVTILAVDVSFAPGIQTGKDFNTMQGRHRQEDHLGLMLIHEAQDCDFGGKDFSRMDFKSKGELGNTEYESIVSTVVRGYALTFVVAAQTPDRLEALVETLNTLEFGPVPAFPPGSPPGGRHLGAAGAAVQILTPTEGVDFTAYVGRFLPAVKRNWYAVMPEPVMLGEKGMVSVVVNIQHDGKLGDGPAVERSSGKVPLDQAALTAIRNSAPFDPLPDAFHGPSIRIRMVFLYNLPADYAE